MKRHSFASVGEITIGARISLVDRKAQPGEHAEADRVGPLDDEPPHDIDRGGLLAHLFGTVAVLEPTMTEYPLVLENVASRTRCRSASSTPAPPPPNSKEQSSSESVFSRMGRMVGLGGSEPAETTASTSADITARALTISASGTNRVYDGTTSDTVTLGDNRVAGDVLTTSYTAAHTHRSFSASF